jgi:hypothetical protein
MIGPKPRVRHRTKTSTGESLLRTLLRVSSPSMHRPLVRWLRLSALPRRTDAFWFRLVRKLAGRCSSGLLAQDSCWSWKGEREPVGAR